MNKDYNQGIETTVLFGVQLPPKKKQKVDRYLTMRFVLLGPIPSIKNRQRATSNTINILKNVCKKLGIQEAVFDNDEHFNLSTVISQESVLNKFQVTQLLRHLRIKYSAWIYKPTKYVEWSEKVKPKIIEQAAYWKKKFERFNLIYPLNNVTMKVHHYWGPEAGNPERDLVNKLESLQDTFVQCGILTDDSWKHLRKIASESEYYGTEIPYTITVIDITEQCITEIKHFIGQQESSIVDKLQ